MKKIKRLSTIALVALMCLPVSAQVKIHGVYEWMRNDDGDQPIEWVGSIYDENGKYTGKTLYFVPQGLYSMSWDGSALTAPEKDPPVTKEAVVNESGQVDMEKAEWASNFNLMSGNSGAVCVDGKIITIHSRDESSTTDEELFAVRKWDAATGNLESGKEDYYPKSAVLESAGMAYNPVDGEVYGLFYLTGQELPSEITEDPEYFEDQDADLTDGDAGYAICRIDLTTMQVYRRTPGLYYANFITFAINNEGRAFALTSGGTSGAVMSDGKVTDINGNLAGAHLYEFDLTTGLMKTKAVEAVDEETGETYTEHVGTYDYGTGYCSQYRRQAACFDKNEPNKMYWVGFVNSGKGVNEWGSWSSLPDKDWKENGKYDTALYEVDITTGEATQLSKIYDRYRFSALWVDGGDASVGSQYWAKSHATGIENVTLKPSTLDSRPSTMYNLAGQKVSDSYKGIVIQNGKKFVVK